MRYFQNTKKYTVLVAHPKGSGSVSIPIGAWVEGNFFARFSYLQEGPLPKGAKVVFSESEFIMGGPINPVTLPPIVRPHTLKPAIDVGLKTLKEEPLVKEVAAKK